MKDCNLRISSQAPICDYPLSMDLYSGCTHGCVYCFARSFNNFTITAQDRYEHTEPIKYKKLLRLINGNYRNSTGVNGLLQKVVDLKQPIHVGGMADPFPRGVEEKLGHAKRFIEAVGDYPLIWSTKNPIPEYAEIMKDGNHILQCSILGFGEKVRKIERGCFSPEERLENLKAYKGKVKKIIIRLQPFIIWMFKKEKDFDDYMRKISEVADGVTVEFLKVQYTASLGDMNKALGIDVEEYYRETGFVEGHEYIETPKKKAKALLMAKKYAEKYGLEFYASDNTFRDLSSCTQCCGIQKDDGEIWQSKMRFNISKLAEVLKQEGKIKVDDFIKENCPEFFKGGCELDLNWNSGDKLGYEKAKKNTIEDKFREVFTTKNVNHPAMIMPNIETREIGGELYYVYVDRFGLRK